MGIRIPRRARAQIVLRRDPAEGRQPRHRSAMVPPRVAEAKLLGVAPQGPRTAGLPVGSERRAAPLRLPFTAVHMASNAASRMQDYSPRTRCDDSLRPSNALASGRERVPSTRLLGYLGGERDHAPVQAPALLLPLSSSRRRRYFPRWTSSMILAASRALKASATRLRP